MSVTNTTPVLACVPSAIAPGDRQAHFGLAKELLQQRAQERVALPNGYAICFPVDALEAVARFAANERKCCPFLTFRLEVAPERSLLWLQLTAPGDVKPFLVEELGHHGATH